MIEAIGTLRGCRINACLLAYMCIGLRTCSSIAVLSRLLQVLQRVRWRDEFSPVAPPDPEAIRLLLLLDIASAQGFPSRNVAVRWQLNWNPDLWHIQTDSSVHAVHEGQLQASFIIFIDLPALMLSQNVECLSPKVECLIKTGCDLFQIQSFRCNPKLLLHQITRGLLKEKHDNMTADLWLLLWMIVAF